MMIRLIQPDKNPGRGVTELLRYAHFSKLEVASSADSSSQYSMFGTFLDSTRYGQSLGTIRVSSTIQV